MFRKQRMALASVAAVGVLAVVAPGLTADIGLPDDAPAAGQGVAELQGFTVTDINWTIDEDGVVTVVSFDISRDNNDPVEAAADGSSGNAIVRVRLEIDEDTVKDWQGCDVTAGAATCTLADDAQMEAAELGQVNFIAFDKN